MSAASTMRKKIQRSILKPFKPVPLKRLKKRRLLLDRVNAFLGRVRQSHLSSSTAATKSRGGAWYGNSHFVAVSSGERVRSKKGEEKEKRREGK
ncbi:hypothetical protein AAC387_Pa08g2347 [Persea americana]